MTLEQAMKAARERGIRTRQSQLLYAYVNPNGRTEYDVTLTLPGRGIAIGNYYPGGKRGYLVAGWKWRHRRHEDWNELTPEEGKAIQKSICAYVSRRYGTPKYGYWDWPTFRVTWGNRMAQILKAAVRAQGFDGVERR